MNLCVHPRWVFGNVERHWDSYVNCLITHREKGKKTSAFTIKTESFAKIGTADVAETTGLHWSNCYWCHLQWICYKDLVCIGEQKNPQQLQVYFERWIKKKKNKGQCDGLLSGNSPEHWLALRNPTQTWGKEWKWAWLSSLRLSSQHPDPMRVGTGRFWPLWKFFLG